MSLENAKQEPFTAPLVDHLSIRILVDSRYENILPREEHAFATVEHVGDIPGKMMKTLAAEWGLSLHIASQTDGARAEYLLDFGWTPEVINRNFELLDIDPSKLTGLILSHGHTDHFGGLQGFLDQNRSGLRDDLKLYVGGEDVFLHRWVKDELADPETGEHPLVSWGQLDRAELLAKKVTPVCCQNPHVLEGGFTSGYIERRSFERTTSHTFIEAPDHFTAEERGGKLVIDDHPEEHALCYMVKGRGLVVISACGHIGIVNSVKTAMAITGVDHVHAVIGGFHLAASKPDYINFTVDALAELNPDVVLPMHCTGPDFIEVMRQRMPEKLIGANLGSRYTFGV